MLQMAQVSDCRAKMKKAALDTSCCLMPNSSSSTIQDAEMMNNNNLMAPKQLTRTYSFPNKATINLHFSDLKYTVAEWSFSKGRERKEILHGVSGEFRSGELSVIMGPSGAGKSTLLNVLAGYKTHGASGGILVNNRVRDMAKFSRASCYIQQEDTVRAMLTAHELMMSTAHLKLANSITTQNKLEKIQDLLCMLCLEECQHTRCGLLSGGQKKRLSIALELLGDPPVLFLDEPTTGLDSSSCSHCVSLLKMLAVDGRTIVCTIHQPSALIFEMFDYLYALADGHCIYQGTVTSLLTHLDKFGLQCPNYHNPADFLMDVSMGEYGADIAALADAAQLNMRCSLTDVGFCHMKKDAQVSDVDALMSGRSDKQINMKQTTKKKKKNGSVCEATGASLWMQFYLLLYRHLTTISRDYSRLLVRLMAHIVIGLIFGYLYRGVGYSASTVLGNCVFIYGSLLFLVYTGKMAVTLSFPLDFKMLRREHFNGWYSLGPYYLSLVLIEIPMQVFCALVYLIISYPLTGQPLEVERIATVFLLCILATLTSQGFGFFIGITTPVKVAVFIGPVIVVVLSMFGFNIFYRDIPVAFRWLFHASYFRAAYHSTMFSIYNNRSELPCPEQEYYCHFKLPSKFLQDMDIVFVDVPFNICFLMAWGLSMYLLAVVAVWWRLNRR